jgi:uncharacterized protein
MIGAAASIFLLFNGRVMGTSRIIGELVDRRGRGNWIEPAAFLFGLISVPAMLARAMGTDTHLTGKWILIGLAGTLAGLGTRLAGGCTTWHGVCGISRLSLCGIVFTLIYLLAGGTTIAVLRHAFGGI